ncbi:MAG: sensor histidine kinase [Candidatus Dormibacteria bacterium]
MRLLKGSMLGSETASAVIRFMVAALVAAAVILAGAYWVVSRNAVSEATRNAQEIAAIDGRGIVAPALTAGIASGDPAAISTLDTVVREHVLSSRVVRVKLWTPGGRIAYSDARELVGRTFGLGDDELSAIRDNRIAADVSDLTKPENQLERGYGRLLEVYLPVRTATGETYLFETYQVYSSIDDDQRRIWAAFFPVLVGGIALLLVVQVPLAWGLARSLETARREREAALQRAIRSSETERRRIARDLHDGVVQTLAGSAFGLGAAAATAPDERSAEILSDGAAVARQAVTDLRSLIVEIAPPSLDGSRLEGALTELLVRFQDEGVKTELEASGLESLGRESAALLYRAGQEAIRNAAAHAGATTISVVIRAAGGSAVLQVRDDGRGFTAAELIERQRQGHVGLSLLRSLVEDGGGEIAVSSEPGGGSVVEIRLESR